MIHNLLKIINLMHLKPFESNSLKCIRIYHTTSFLRQEPKKPSTYYDTMTTSVSSFTSGLQNRVSGLHNDAKNITTDFNQIMVDFNLILKKHRYDDNKIKIITVLISVIFMFLFWRTFKSYISTETSDIASKTINDDEFKKNVYILSDQIIYYLKTNPDAQKQITELLQICIENVSKDEKCMTQLNHLISDLILSKQTSDSANKLASEVIDTQLNDKKNQHLLSQLFYDAAIKALSKFRPW